MISVYEREYNPDYPVVCLDESDKQMFGEVWEPLPMSPGQPKRVDDEYIRYGVAEIFWEVEPLAGVRNVAITERRTKYEAFPPEEAFRLAQRLEIHHTPKHGSWLKIAEIELSVLKRQCLPERISNIGEMRRSVQIWNAERNSKQTPVDWQFKTTDARIKRKRLYPKF